MTDHDATAAAPAGQLATRRERSASRRATRRRITTAARLAGGVLVAAGLTPFVVSEAQAAVPTKPCTYANEYERTPDAIVRAYSAWQANVVTNYAVQGGPGATMFVERSVEKSTSISGSVDTASAYRFLSATLGFSVERSWSKTDTSGVSYSVPQGRYGRIVLMVPVYNGVAERWVCYASSLSQAPSWQRQTWSYTVYRRNQSYYAPQYSTSRYGPWA